MILGLFLVYSFVIGLIVKSIINAYFVINVRDIDVINYVECFVLCGFCIFNKFLILIDVVVLNDIGFIMKVIV